MITKDKPGIWCGRCGARIIKGTLTRHYQVNHPRVNINGIMKLMITREK